MLLKGTFETLIDEKATRFELRILIRCGTRKKATAEH
jgi:hypothetical protein